VHTPAGANALYTEESTEVWFTDYGFGKLAAERTPLGFTVALKDGDPNAEFSYRVVAKRLGFEEKRLEPAPWADTLGQ
jgi:hypothetical protein